MALAPASSNSPAGAAGGDLSGTFPSPTVAKVNGIAVTGTPQSGYVPTATGATAATWQAAGGGGATELAYVEKTSNTSITATTESGATSIVSAGAVVFGGSTRVLIEFFSCDVIIAASAQCIIVLFDGSSSIGLWSVGTNSGAGGQATGSVHLQRFITPSAASHTYSARAYRVTTDCTVGGGSGGVGNLVPAFIRITTA